MSSSLVAVCQMTSTSDKDKNFETAKSLIADAKARGAKMVFLPECFDLVGESKKQSVELAESLDGPLMTKYKEIAASGNLWLSLGGFHEKGIDFDFDKIYNTHVIIDNKGKIASTYRKIHLFDISVPGGVQLKESDYVVGGGSVSIPVRSDVGVIGLGICYDMRFPEFSLAMAKAGADILTFPSAFTQTTGMAHWEALLRARAIESQCYVVAAAQVGRHNSKRSSYGHAMIVDPWGCVIACCGEGTGIATAKVDLGYTRKIREGMPLWLHRRPDLYGDVIPPMEDPSNLLGSFKFGEHDISRSIIFYKTRYSMAFVNRKPVVPGHVLVATERVISRMTYLCALEITDLFNLVMKVQLILQEAYNVSSTTVVVQDGADAGQTVPHVHVHVLPRKPGDFKRNDDIYMELEKHDKGDDTKFRTQEEMEAETNMLRKYFHAPLF